MRVNRHGDRRRFAVLASVLVTVSAAVLLSPAVPPASGTTAPTISAPAVVPYWAAFALSGASDPDASVNIYYKRTTWSSYHLLRTVTANGVGNYTTSVRIAADSSFYAAASGVSSSAVTVRIRTTTCSTSGAIFPMVSMPVPSLAPAPGDPYYYGFAAVTATRAGTWAGVAYDYGRYAVITWVRGHPVQVLDRFSYTATEPSETVKVVGILPSGGVVVSAQVLNPSTHKNRQVGFVYQAGVKYALLTPPHWTLASPVGVTTQGAIVGSFAYLDSHGTTNYGVVRWASPSASPRVLALTSTQPPYTVVDRNGDIAYLTGSTDAWKDAVVRLASGSVRSLGSPFGPYSNLFAEVGDAGSTIYGTATADSRGDQAVLSWTLGNPPTSGEIPARQITAPGYNSQPMAAGPHGRVLVGYPIPRRMLTPSGAFPALPAIFGGGVTGVRNPGNAIDAYGTVAFTSARDHLVHLLSCA